MYSQWWDENIDLQGRLDKLEQQNVSSSSSVSERVPKACVTNSSGTEINELRTELRRKSGATWKRARASSDAITIGLRLSLDPCKRPVRSLIEEVQVAWEEADALRAAVEALASQRDNALKGA
jgi:hypothetical protein